MGNGHRLHASPRPGSFVVDNNPSRAPKPYSYNFQLFLADMVADGYLRRRRISRPAAPNPKSASEAGSGAGASVARTCSPFASPSMEV